MQHPGESTNPTNGSVLFGTVNGTVGKCIGTVNGTVGKKLQTQFILNHFEDISS